MEKTHCVIITAYCPDDITELVADIQNDYVICADGGKEIAARHGIKPDIIIGDFDSSSAPQQTEGVIVVPVEKDDTDTMLCIKHAIAMGCKSITIIGGIGGRLDHTVANIQSLYYCAKAGVEAKLAAEKNTAWIMLPGKYTIEREEGRKLSFFAYSQKVQGITLIGTKYTLEGAELESSFPLGVSNEFSEPFVNLSFESGVMLCVLSKD